jgi:hypothetical protein
MRPRRESSGLGGELNTCLVRGFEAVANLLRVPEILTLFVPEILAA